MEQLYELYGIVVYRDRGAWLVFSHPSTKELFFLTDNKLHGLADERVLLEADHRLIKYEL